MHNHDDIYAHNAQRRSNILKGFTNADDLLEKGGEGTRGGKVVGHTASGKPIYEHGGGDEQYTKQDHYDAADYHHKESSKGWIEASKSHTPEAKAHLDLGNDHVSKGGAIESKEYYAKEAAKDAARAAKAAKKPAPSKDDNQATADNKKTFESLVNKRNRDPENEEHANNLHKFIASHHEGGEKAARAFSDSFEPGEHKMKDAHEMTDNAFKSSKQ